MIRYKSIQNLININVVNHYAVDCICTQELNSGISYFLSAGSVLYVFEPTGTGLSLFCTDPDLDQDPDPSINKQKK